MSSKWMLLIKYEYVAKKFINNMLISDIIATQTEEFLTKLQFKNLSNADIMNMYAEFVEDKDYDLKELLQNVAILTMILSA